MRRIKPYASQNRARLFPFSRRKKDDVAVFNIQQATQTLLFILREELENGRFPFAALTFNKRQTFGAVRFGGIFQTAKFALCEVCQTFRIKGLDRPARLERPGKNFEFRICKNLRAILQLHAKAHIGLINPEAVHGVKITHPQKRRLQFDPKHILPYAFHEALDQGIHVLAINEG